MVKAAGIATSAVVLFSIVIVASVLTSWCPGRAATTANAEFTITLHPYPVEGWLEVDISGFPEGQVPERMVAALSQSGREVVSAKAEPAPRPRHVANEPYLLYPRKVQIPKQQAPGGEPILAGQPQARARLPIANLPAGSYDVRVSVRDAGGAILGAEEARFEMPPPAPWLSDREGLAPELPVGFPPVQAEGSVVRVWGREYRFGGGPLLSYVSTHGAEVLAGPVEMRAKWSGGEGPFVGPAARLARWSRLGRRSRAWLRPGRCE